MTELEKECCFVSSEDTQSKLPGLYILLGNGYSTVTVFCIYVESAYPGAWQVKSSIFDCESVAHRT